jgi:hypothetical protein
MPERLIVTNGDVAVARLRDAGVEAEFLPWHDALHDGPVPAGLLLEARSLVRAQFLAKEFGLRINEVARQFEQRNAAIRNHGQYQRIELWFEHDLYDQLQLIELLEFFADEKRSEDIFLVQAGDYLGTLPPDVLRALAETARPVSAADFADAKRAWAAFTAPTPEKLAALAIPDMATLPYLASSLRRWLQEFPSIASGLSLTEERTLRALSNGGQTVPELFAATQKQEPARFLGDASLFRRVDRLAFGPHPLVAGLPFPFTRCAGGPPTLDHAAYSQARVTLTDTGRAALAGRFDHATENAVERWLGGTHLTPKRMWRRDAGGRLVIPSG